MTTEEIRLLNNIRKENIGILEVIVGSAIGCAIIIGGCDGCGSYRDIESKIENVSSKIEISENYEDKRYNELKQMIERLDEKIQNQYQSGNYQSRSIEKE